MSKPQTIVRCVEDKENQQDHGGSNVVGCTPIFGNGIVGVVGQGWLFELDQQLRNIVGEVGG